MGITNSVREGARSPAGLTEKVHQIRDILKELSLQETLEVIANVLIFEGMAFMGHPPNEVNPLTVYGIVSDNIRKDGPNMANSTAKLGVELLVSLNRIE